MPPPDPTPGGTQPVPATARGFVRSYAVELLALSGAAATILLLRASGLRVGLAEVRYTLLPMLPSLPRILLAGLGLQLLVALVRGRGRGASDYLRAVASIESALSWLRICAAFMLVTLAYTWLKVCVPLLHHRLWDAELWRLDSFLHLGFSPSVFAVELLRGTALAALIDRWYGAWILSVFLVWSFAAADRDPRARRHFAFATAALSLAGVWLYLALPALGPCYAFREVFAGIAPELPRALHVQGLLEINYAKMLAGRDGSLRQFNPYFGVAAMPSLHVGAHLLFALWAKRWARWLYVPFLLATLLTFVGSLATGWHYAVDGYVGLLLAWLAIRLADRLESAPGAEVTAAGGGGEGGTVEPPPAAPASPAPAVR